MKSLAPLPLPAAPLDLLSGSALGWATAVSLALIPASLALLVLAALWSGLAQSLWVRIPAVAVAATAIYELTFLNIQAARGVRSHFNADTLFDRVGGAIMAGGAGVLVLSAALIGAAILVALALKGRAALDEPVLLALGLGLVLGGWLGGYTGGAIGANHGPFVGAAEGPFVPVLG